MYLYMSVNAIYDSEIFPKCVVWRIAMVRRRTHEEFVEELKVAKPDIQPIEIYKNSQTPMKFKCVKDEHEWYATPNNVLHTTGCPKCAGNIKRTHEEFVREVRKLLPHLKVISEYTGAHYSIEVECTKHNYRFSRLAREFLKGVDCPKCNNRRLRSHDEFVEDMVNVDPNIEVLGVFTKLNDKIKVKCKVDGYEWESLAGNLLSGRGCAKCSNRITIDYEMFLERLNKINNNVQIIGEWNGSRHSILCKCLIDGHEWRTTPRELLKGRGCPKCSGTLRKVPEDFPKRLASVNKDVTPLEPYVMSKIPIKTQCNLCGDVWSVTPKALLRGTRCPKCFGTPLKTHEQFLSDLKEINNKVVVLDTYSGNKIKLLTQCKVCQHEWFANPGKLLIGRGCPECSKTGFKTSEVGELYIYRFQEYLGFGITNVPKARHSDHRLAFRKRGIEAQLIRTFSGKGSDIQALESLLKKTLPIVDTGIPGFRTEAILYEHRDMLFKAIEDFQLLKNPLDRPSKPI